MSWFHRITRATTVIPLPGYIYRLKKNAAEWEKYIRISKGNYSKRAPDIRTKEARGPSVSRMHTDLNDVARLMVDVLSFKELIAEALRAMWHRHTRLCSECLSESGRSKWAFGRAHRNFLCRPLLVHVIWGKTFFGLLHWFDGPHELFLHLFLFLRGRSFWSRFKVWSILYQTFIFYFLFLSFHVIKKGHNQNVKTLNLE